MSWRSVWNLRATRNSANGCKQISSMHRGDRHLNQDVKLTHYHHWALFSTKYWIPSHGHQQANNMKCLKLKHMWIQDSSNMTWVNVNSSSVTDSWIQWSLGTWDCSSRPTGARAAPAKGFSHPPVPGCWNSLSLSPRLHIITLNICSLTTAKAGCTNQYSHSLERVEDQHSCKMPGAGTVGSRLGWNRSLWCPG